MPHRRPTAIAALMLTAAAALTSCGFEYPTDRVNQIAAGANEREATVDVLGVRVVATRDGYGRLIGTLANNEPEDVKLTAVEAPEGNAQVELTRVTVPGNGRVNLADPQEDPILVTGEFTAGGYVDLEFAFDSDESVTLNVPVVKHCFHHTEVPVPSEEPTTEPTEEESPTDEATEGAATDAAAADETATEATDDHAAHETATAEAHTDEAHTEGEESDHASVAEPGPAYACEHEPGTTSGGH